MLTRTTDPILRSAQDDPRATTIAVNPVSPYYL